MNWKAYAVLMQVLCLMLLSTFIALSSLASNLSLRGVAMWFVVGAGHAIPVLLLGCLGLLYKQDRLAGFATVLWFGVALMLLGHTV